MNCEQTTTIITELARGQLLDANERERALAHARECAACAARSADEKALTVQLNTLKVGSAEMSVPAHLESALQSAFREHSSAAATAPRRLSRRRRWFAQIGAATAAAVLLALTLSLSRRPVAESDKGQNGKSNDSTGAVARVPSDAQSYPAVNNVEGGSSSPAASSLVSRPANDRQTHSTHRVARTTRGVPANFRPGTKTAPGAAEQQAEVTTEFLPLTYGGTAAGALESGHVVRVELPRSTLASMNLPVNTERSEETVKADVLLSDDGVARAIRFIR